MADSGSIASLMCDAPNCPFGDECPRKWFKDMISSCKFLRNVKMTKNFSEEKDTLYPMIVKSIHPTVDDMQVYPSECIEAEAFVRFFINTEKVPFKQLIETTSLTCFKAAIFDSSGYRKHLTMSDNLHDSVGVSGWREVIGLLARSIPTECIFKYTDGEMGTLVVEKLRYSMDDNGAVIAIYFHKCTFMRKTGEWLDVQNFWYNIITQTWSFRDFSIMSSFIYVYDTNIYISNTVIQYESNVPPFKSSYIKACR